MYALRCLVLLQLIALVPALVPLESRRLHEDAPIKVIEETLPEEFFDDDGEHETYIIDDDFFKLAEKSNKLKDESSALLKNILLNSKRMKDGKQTKRNYGWGKNCFYTTKLVRGCSIKRWKKKVYHVCGDRPKKVKMCTSLD